MQICSSVIKIHEIPSFRLFSWCFVKPTFSITALVYSTWLFQRAACFEQTLFLSELAVRWNVTNWIIFSIRIAVGIMLFQFNSTKINRCIAFWKVEIFQAKQRFGLNFLWISVICFRTILPYSFRCAKWCNIKSSFSLVKRSWRQTNSLDFTFTSTFINLLFKWWQ